MGRCNLTSALCSGGHPLRFTSCPPSWHCRFLQTSGRKVFHLFLLWGSVRHRNGYPFGRIRPRCFMLLWTTSPTRATRVSSEGPPPAYSSTSCPPMIGGRYHIALDGSGEYRAAKKARPLWPSPSGSLLPQVVRYFL